MAKATNKPRSLHLKNKHLKGYNFTELCVACPVLKKFVFTNKFGTETIDFANAEGIKELNTALLLTYYNIKFWKFPDDNLCPPIPGRADYIFHLAELLGFDTAAHSKETLQRHVRILDLGCGANCIYPLLGKSLFGWSFIGSETDKMALESAETILEKMTFMV